MDFNNGDCVIEFYATWCGPCNMFRPIFEKVQNEFTNIKFYSIDVDKDRNNLSKKFGIMSIPALVLLKDGKEIKKSIGFMSEDELKKLLKNSY